MIKKIGDLTLRELKDLCRDKGECDNCEAKDDGNLCMLLRVARCLTDEIEIEVKIK